MKNFEIDFIEDLQHIINELDNVRKILAANYDSYEDNMIIRCYLKDIVYAAEINLLKFDNLREKKERG